MEIIHDSSAISISSSCYQGKMVIIIYLYFYNLTRRKRADNIYVYTEGGNRDRDNLLTVAGIDEASFKFCA